MTRRPVIIAILLVILVVGFIFFGFLRRPLFLSSQDTIYIVREGSSFPVVIKELRDENNLKHPFLFSLLVLAKQGAHSLKAGEYLFRKGVLPAAALQQLMTGTGFVQHPFTIIAGWKFQQVKDALNKQEPLKHTISALNDEELMKKLGHPTENPEGLFFPDTYYFSRGTPDIKLLKLAYTQMSTHLQKQWDNRSSDLPYQTAYQALIAASLIEKEAHYDDERPIISGVLINRLSKNMLLQIDPTVIYGMGSRYTGNITKTNLLEDTPYNTYRHKGLPPTPICMPGLSSIEAAVHPAQNNFLYFVASGDGRHHFSSTLQEHNKAVSAAKKNENHAIKNKGPA